MTTTKASNTRTTTKRRRPAKPTGAKLLLTSLALGGALAGWAGLAMSAANQTATPVENAPAAPMTQAVVATTQDAVQTLQLPPIATVVPPPNTLNAVALSAPAAPQQRTALAAIPAVPQVVVRRPLARTRSSR